MTRTECLDAAKAAVTGHREADYGSPEDSFATIGRLWAAYRQGRPQGSIPDFTPADVAAMLALLKIARLASSPGHTDSWVDLAGYAACGAEIASKEKA